MLLNLIYFIKMMITITSIFIINYIAGYNIEYLYDILYNDIILNGCLAIKFTQWIVSRLKILYNKEDLPN